MLVTRKELEPAYMRKGSEAAPDTSGTTCPLFTFSSVGAQLVVRNVHVIRAHMLLLGCSGSESTTAGRPGAKVGDMVEGSHTRSAAATSTCMPVMSNPVMLSGSDCALEIYVLSVVNRIVL